MSYATAGVATGAGAGLMRLAEMILAQRDAARAAEMENRRFAEQGRQFDTSMRATLAAQGFTPMQASDPALKVSTAPPRGVGDMFIQAAGPPLHPGATAAVAPETPGVQQGMKDAAGMFGAKPRDAFSLTGAGGDVTRYAFDPSRSPQYQQNLMQERMQGLRQAEQLQQQAQIASADRQAQADIARANNATQVRVAQIYASRQGGGATGLAANGVMARYIDTQRLRTLQGIANAAVAAIPANARVNGQPVNLRQPVRVVEYIQRYAPQLGIDLKNYTLPELYTAAANSLGVGLRNDLTGARADLLRSQDPAAFLEALQGAMGAP